MRFKVGDIVRVKPDLNLSNQYKGYIVETNSGEYKKSYLVKIPGYDGHDGLLYSKHGPYPTKEYWYVSDGERQLEVYKPTINELVGKVIVLRNETAYFVYKDSNDEIWGANNYHIITLSTYNDDLTYSGNDCFDIIIVKEPNISNLSYIYNGNEIIWEGNELKKMTKKEIEQQLGYRIEIVEEK